MQALFDILIKISGCDAISYSVFYNVTKTMHWSWISIEFYSEAKAGSAKHNGVTILQAQLSVNFTLN